MPIQRLTPEEKKMFSFFMDNENATEWIPNKTLPEKRETRNKSIVSQTIKRIAESEEKENDYELKEQRSKRLKKSHKKVSLKKILEHDLLNGLFCQNKDKEELGLKSDTNSESNEERIKTTKPIISQSKFKKASENIINDWKDDFEKRFDVYSIDLQDKIYSKQKYPWIIIKDEYANIFGFTSKHLITVFSLVCFLQTFFKSKPHELYYEEVLDPKIAVRNITGIERLPENYRLMMRFTEQEDINAFKQFSIIEEGEYMPFVDDFKSILRDNYHPIIGLINQITCPVILYKNDKTVSTEAIDSMMHIENLILRKNIQFTKIIQSNYGADRYYIEVKK